MSAGASALGGVALALCASVTAQGQDATRPDRTFLAQPLTRVPLSVSAAGIEVQVRLGDRGPFTFVLDPGRPGDGAIDGRLARRLELLRRESAQWAAVPVLHLGGAACEGVDLRVEDLDGRGGIQGVLGGRVLADVVAVLDLSGAEMLLYRGTLPAADSALFATANERDRASVEARIGGQRRLVDLDLRQAATLRTSADERDAIEIGTETIDDPEWEQAGENTRPSFGRSLLARHRLALDVGGRRLQLQPATDAATVLDVRRTRTGHLLVQPHIDGAQRGWFVFDTGATASAIGNDTAAARKLKAIGEGRTVSPTRTHQTTLWQCSSLRLGPLHLADARFTGLDLGTMARHVGGANGVLGSDLWQHCVLEIDVRSATVAVHDPATFRLAGVDWQPFELSQGVPLIDARYEGHDGRFLLDTGDSGTLTVFTRAVQRFDLLRDRPVVVELHSEVGGDFEMMRGWLGDFALAGHALPGPPASFAANIRSGMMGSNLASGSVGCALFDGFTLILDYPQQRFAMLPRDRRELSSGELEPLAGTYSTGDRTCAVRLNEDQDRLLFRGPGEGAPELPLEFVVGRRFRLPYDLGTCQFERGRSDRATHVVWSVGNQPGERWKRQ